MDQYVNSELHSLQVPEFKAFDQPDPVVESEAVAIVALNQAVATRTEC